MEYPFLHRLEIRDAVSDQPIKHMAPTPMLIHGTESSNASLLASAIAQLAVRNDESVIVLSLHRSDIRKFRLQVGVGQPEKGGTQVDEPTIASIDDNLLIAVTYPTPANLLHALRSFPGWDDRWILILGAEKTLTNSIWRVVRAARKLVVVGDLAQSTIPIELEAFSRRIAFSPWPKNWHFQRPKRPGYIGVNESTNQEVIVLSK